MDMKKTKQGKVIGTIGTLDLRKATESSLSDIERVDTVGTVLYSPETAYLVPSLKAGVVGSTIEAPNDAKLLSGHTVFNKHSLQDAGKPMSFVISGELVIEPDVPVGSIEAGIDALVISGHIIVPEHLSGVVQSKIRHLSGEMKTYSQQAQLAAGSLVLDEVYLRALGDSTELMVIGSLMATEVLPNDLLEAKIGAIQVSGRVKVREENAQTIMSLLSKKQRPARITIIPAGFELVDMPLELDNTLLESLPSRKLYCTGLVTVDGAVKSETLDNTLDSLVITNMLIAPAALTKSISQKINMLETKAIFYEGELWLIEDEATIAPAQFEFLSDKATLVVLGEVSFGTEVKPEVLFSRLDKVHNFGEIKGTAEQIAAVQARMGRNEGSLNDSSKSETEREWDVGTVGYLQL